MRTAARVPGLARGEQLEKGPRQRPPRAAGLFHPREMLSISRWVDRRRACGARAFWWQSAGGRFGLRGLRRGGAAPTRGVDTMDLWSNGFFLRRLAGFAPG